MQSRERKPRARARVVSRRALPMLAWNTHSPCGTSLIPLLLQLAFFPYLLAKWNSPVDRFSQPASQPGSHLATPSRHTGAPYRPVGAGYGPGNENESLFFHGPPFFILPLPAPTCSRAARNSRDEGGWGGILAYSGKPVHTPRRSHSSKSLGVLFAKPAPS